MSEVSFKDRGMGLLAETVSGLSVHIRPLGRLVIGDDKRLVPVHYRRVRVHEVPGNTDCPAVAHYDGIEGQTTWPRPRDYRYIARTFVQQPEALNRGLLTVEDGKIAVAWYLGKQAMAAIVPDEIAQRMLQEGVYDMRLGGNPLDTTIGVQRPGERDLFVFPDMHLQPGSVNPIEHYPEDGLFL